MSEINPDFSFPSVHPARDQLQVPSPTFNSSPVLTGGIPSSATPGFDSADGWTQSRCSPTTSRPKKHAHRRSAAMSEDLSAVELATLLTPQMPSGSVFPNSPKSSAHTTHDLSPKTSNNAFMNSPHTPSMHASVFQPLPAGVAAPGTVSFEDSLKPESLHRISVVSSPSPRRPFGEPGELMPLPTSAVPDQQLLQRQGSGNHGSGNHGSEHKGSTRRKESSFHGSSSDGSPTNMSVEQAKREKRRKRWSYTSIFRKSVDLDAGEPNNSLPDSPTEDGDATLVPNRSNFMQPTTSNQHQPTSSPLGYTSTAIESPIETPRNSGERIRESLPAKPTIDLDEALSCSFDFRGKLDGGILESPFSKASSGMGAVLEEEGENDDGDSESASLSSIPVRRPVSILQKSNSICSSNSSSSAIKNSPASPRFFTGDMISQQQKQKPVYQRDSIQRDNVRTISYVGPVPLQPPQQPMSPRSSYRNAVTPPRSASPSRSRRFSFEQVSNLAIADPQQQPLQPQQYSQSTIKPNVTRTSVLKQHKEPIPPSPTTSSPKKGHARRRSLIERLIKRS